jgi:hypothetical protein
VILEAVAMETVTEGAEPSTPATAMAEGTASELGAAIAPEVRVETQVDSHLGTSTEVVVCETEVQETAPIHSAPMSEATSTSRGGLELLADNLVDPAVLARNMERCAVQSNGSRYVAGTLSSNVLRSSEYLLTVFPAAECH